MKVTGIIVEYNPFHNGHMHHIKKAREVTGCDILVAVMSGNFTQRGDVAICDKFMRTRAALENGVDMVVELPYIFATQAAENFAYGSIETLKLCNVDSLVFGSESNNLENLIDIAKYSINVNHLKVSMSKGESFAKSYSLLQGSFPPNDILGIAYLKAIQGSNITPYTILRTNSYHDQELGKEISSATSIRKALKENLDYSNSTIMKINNPVFNKMLYPYLRNILITCDRKYLQEIFLVSEGIEKHLYNVAQVSYSYADFINKATTRRYTKSRIQRTCVQILNHITKKEVEELPDLNFIRVLGFNNNGRKLLKKLKKNEEIRVCSRYSTIPLKYREISYKTTFTYSSMFNEKLQKEILENEIGGPIIIE
jgi:predicted nucleotidyltransferase